ERVVADDRRRAETLRARRAAAVGIALAVMAAGMVGLFAITPPIAPLWWFAAMLTLVFSSFSFLTICFYAQGVARAGRLGRNGHVRLARWRETGALLGICLAAILPTVLGSFGLFALLFAGACAAAWWAMRREWQPGPTDLPPAAPSGFAPVLRDPVARRLLVIALLNAAPVAVSSTLFLFFVESRLNAPGTEGVLLLLFFLAAAIAAPLWGWIADRMPVRRALLIGMALSVAAFSLALGLGTGDVWLFALVCVASGAALGADLTLLPALFARRMAQIAPAAAEGFALWSFVSKFTLALAAVGVLPMLDAAGFQSGPMNSDAALSLLTWLYAGVPCALKLIAMALLATTPVTTT
ncbi:MAG: MFS transporter, partial [Primorskyibacter sp.]